MPDDVYQAPVPPRVSVILVVRNQAIELRRALIALEKSTERDRMEIIVIDRASADETPTLDQQFPSINMLRLPHDFGAIQAMNIASRTAKGDCLFFLVPNVEVEPGTVMALAERMESDSGAAAVCPLLVDESGNPSPQLHPFPDKNFFARESEQPQPLTVPHAEPGVDAIDAVFPASDAILVRRQFIGGMNYFDKRLGQHWADADLVLRVYHAQKKIRIYPSVPVKWHAPLLVAPNDMAHQADRILGAAVLLGKYYGFFPGFTFRAAAALKALATFKLGLFSALLSGQKLDGSGVG